MFCECFIGALLARGTSGIDIDLRRVDIDQCPLRPGSTQLNIFAASDKCKKRTTQWLEWVMNVNPVLRSLTT
ncbi:putative G-protein coupled receptor 158 [Frankliniella fusca]|uniref:G-protein coupled receptor 158 n=1 Tax=Frankliniella fusca TaxID=407009 RepID=A0AAE1LH25_9NEOP|nr:putative G-protein coupled receptor 158 [Frankliniella fusca]